MKVFLNNEQIAAEWSCSVHEETNHHYDGHAYGHHLSMVVTVARKFIHLIQEEHKETILMACWAHDTIEDARKTYNDVKFALGEPVAEIVYAVTNDKGKNRNERAGAKYYQGIRDTPGASFVKLCDRIANVEYSKTMESSMYGKYQKEMKHFLTEVIDDEVLEPMVKYLKEL